MPRVSRRYPDGRSFEAAAGFTLLELVIVMVLVSLFMVVSIPALRNTLLDDPLAVSARRLIGYLGSLREMAVGEQQGYLVVADLDENRLWFRSESALAKEDAEPPESGLYSPVAPVRLKDVWRRETGAVVSGQAELWMSRQGYLKMTVVHLEDSDGKTLSLLLRPFLPEIEVRDGYYEPDQNER